MRWQWLRGFAERFRTVTVFVWTLFCLFAAAAVDAEPMDLRDPQPRWVEVRFEVSPHERPGQRDSVYTQRFPAWLEPDPLVGGMRVTVDASIVERHLMGDQLPLPGSFSDFEWLFDPITGEVLSASLSGKVVNEVSWGLISTTVHSEIDVRMNTEQKAGFEQPRSVLRHRIFPYCKSAGRRSSDCTLVAPSRYQHLNGYVNAVGELTVSSTLVTLHTFSPLGEAIFSELPRWPDVEIELTRPSVGPPLHDHVSAGEATLLGEATRY
jgi:hypothetical protein